MKSKQYIILLIVFFVSGLGSASAQKDTLFHAKYSEFMGMQNAAAQEHFYMNLKKEFPMEHSEQRQSQYKYMLSTLAAAWLKEGNIEKYEMWKEKVGNFDILDFMVGDALTSMWEDGEQINLAAKVAMSYLEGFSKKKAEGAKDYNIHMHAFYLENYAMIQYKLGNGEAALKYMGEASTLMKVKSAEFTTRHAMLLTTYGKPQEALDVLSTAVKSDKYDQQVIKSLSEAYTKVHNGTKGYDSYLASLKVGGYESVYEEVKKQHLKPAPAPKWTFNDLDGKSVSLEELKGKIVIIDFWATWCSPCKAALPGMQLAVDAYADDPNVKFVFISVGEEKEKEKVKGYIDGCGYRFHVLLTPDQSILRDYGAPGLPTKVIIDPEGNIQFKSVGNTGSPESTLNQMKAMIEQVKLSDNRN